jgi:hypothetical protein
MLVFTITLGLFAFLMLAMSVGVLFSNIELKGSCGGATAECACELAGKPRDCEFRRGEEPDECIPVAIGNPSEATQS